MKALVPIIFERCCLLLIIINKAAAAADYTYGIIKLLKIKVLNSNHKGLSILAPYKLLITSTIVG